MLNVSYADLISDSKALANKIASEGKYFDGVYGIPSGGILPAFVISQEFGIPMLQRDQITFDSLVVDDLVDSGETLERLHEKETGKYQTAVLYRKGKTKYEPTYFLKDIGDEWINLPHESKDTQIDLNITRILQYIGEDPKREGLKDTPKRVIKSYKEIFAGYGKNVKDILTTFDGENYDEMVLLKDIEFYSMCEHHMLPFFGKAHVAYIPSKKIVGLSKLARVVDIYARRLQNQERLTMQVACALQEHLEPLGVAVVFEGEHFCMKCRGVGKQNSVMKTAYLTGVFKEDGNNARHEFYDLINKK